MSTLKMVKNARRKRRTRMEMLMRRRVTTRNTCDLTWCKDIFLEERKRDQHMAVCSLRL